MHVAYKLRCLSYYSLRRCLRREVSVVFVSFDNSAGQLVPLFCGWKSVRKLTQKNVTFSLKVMVDMSNFASVFT